jgi:hypothetical protein
MSLKNPVTSPEIDAGTVRLVSLRLKHYATPTHTDARIKKMDTDGDEIFQKNRWYAIFYHKRNEELLEELKE